MVADGEVDHADTRPQLLVPDAGDLGRVEALLVRPGGEVLVDLLDDMAGASSGTGMGWRMARLSRPG
jgi:hypothetical protein